MDKSNENKFESVKFKFLVKGDMLGDSPIIGKDNVEKGKKIFQKLKKLLFSKKEIKKIVLSFGGPSGSGKSSLSAFIGTKIIKEFGFGVYVLSCDNYPHRPPRTNEKHRMKIYDDRKGEKELVDYLGSEKEIDFQRMEKLVEDFKKEEEILEIRIMDNPNNKVLEDARKLDVSNTQVLILEGTWASRVGGCDVYTFLEIESVDEIFKRRANRRGYGGDRDPVVPIDEFFFNSEMKKLHVLKESLQKKENCLFSMIVSPEGEVSVV